MPVRGEVPRVPERRRAVCASVRPSSASSNYCSPAIQRAVGQHNQMLQVSVASRLRFAGDGAVLCCAVLRDLCWIRSYCLGMALHFSEGIPSMVHGCHGFRPIPSISYKYVVGFV